MKMQEKCRAMAAMSVLLIGGAASAQTGELVINEFNAVGDAETLTGCDPQFCRETGNGGNWIELVVVEDGLDIRGWMIQWDNSDGSASYGTITFQDHALWSNLPAGLIITIIEPDASFSTPAVDTSYDTLAGDWNVNLHTSGAGSSDYLQVAGHFKVDNDDWRVRIVDPMMYGNDGSNNQSCPAWVLVQDCVGEKITGWGGGGINNEEGGGLHANPTSAAIGNYSDENFTTFGCPNTWGHTGANEAWTNIQNFTALRGGSYDDDRCGVDNGSLDSSVYYDLCLYDTVNPNDYACN